MLDFVFLFSDHIDKNSPNFPNKDKINRDERRWIAADKNKDGKLDRTEFADFTHPEEAEHLEDIVAHVLNLISINVLCEKVIKRTKISPEI